MITSPAEYRAALAELIQLVSADPAPDSPEGERALLLSEQVEAWEVEHFPIE